MSATNKQQLDCLTGMRGASALIVIFAHCIELGRDTFNISQSFQPAGTLSVDFFFVLSAFLLTYRAFCELMPLPKGQPQQEAQYLPLATEPDSEEQVMPNSNLKMPTRHSILDYAIRRLFRVYPAYFVTLLLPGITPYPATFKLFWERALFLNTDYFHLWTIRIELLYYAMLPMIQILCAYALLLENKCRKANHPFLALLLIFITSLMVWAHVAGYIIGKHLPVFWYGSLAGIAYYFCKKHGYILTDPTGIKQQLTFFGIEIITYGLIVCMIFANHPSSQAFLGRDTWLTMPPDGEHRASFALFFFPLVFLCAVTEGQTTLAKFFTCNFLVWAGKISYSMYLIQCIAIYLVLNYMGVKGFEGVMLVIVAACAVAWVMYSAVEEPGVRLGSWIISKLKIRSQKKAS